MLSDCLYHLKIILDYIALIYSDLGIILNGIFDLPTYIHEQMLLL